MTYLKCNHCGHLNQVKTEYQTFCDSCHKKLGDNYPDWKKQHPGNSFDEFKRLFCVSEYDVLYAATPEKKKSKTGLNYLIAFVVFAIILGIFGVWKGDDLMGGIKNKAINKVLMAAAGEINQSCPIMLDAETRLDNVVAKPGNTLQYNYTLVNQVMGMVDIQALKDYLEPRMVNNVKTNPDMKFLKELGTVFNYYYMDKDGKYLFSLKISPDMYQ